MDDATSIDETSFWLKNQIRVLLTKVSKIFNADNQTQNSYKDNCTSPLEDIDSTLLRTLQEGALKISIIAPTTRALRRIYIYTHALPRKRYIHT